MFKGKRAVSWLVEGTTQNATNVFSFKQLVINIIRLFMLIKKLI